MESKPLISVTVVTDDDTGMYSIGELDFGIHGRLSGYLSVDPIARRDKVLAMMGFLMHRVCELATIEQSKVCPDSQAEAGCQGQKG